MVSTAQFFDVSEQVFHDRVAPNQIVLSKNIHLTNATSKFLMTSLIGHLKEIAMGRFHECFVMGTYLQKFDERIDVCSQCAHSSSLFHQFVVF